ncbi:MAG TPA: Zn-dependent hydrolase [Candidatus Methylomirabilis sp.]|jgi:hydantoinase/carbamoylase family amidase
MTATETGTSLRIDPERLARDLAGLARIGIGEDGSVNRLAFSLADLRGRHYMIHLLQRAGIAVRMDGIGNLIGRIEGRDPRAPAVALGSHIDSVPHGGRFDGSVGVVAALEVARVIRASGMSTERPVEVLIFVAEESSRFGLSTIGSSAMAGEADPARLLGLTDRGGQRLGDILSRFGITDEDVAAARRAPGEIGDYLELHIEQGRILAEEGKPVGVVRAVAAPCRLRVTFTGRADHSGATPMHLRRDALAAAARLVVAVEDACRAPRAVPVVGTVGALEARPGAMNVVPGEAALWIDLRSTSRPERDAVRDALMDAARQIAGERLLRLAVDTVMEDDPVPLDPGVCALLERLCVRRGVAYRLMDSGAGHDAMKMARIARSGLLFVPSREGVSHNPREWTALTDIAAGAQILLEAAVSLAAPTAAAPGPPAGVAHA